MDYNFFVIGGDKRMFYLAKKLSFDGNRVRMLGFEKFGYEELLNNNIKLAHSIDEIKENDILIGGMPLTLDNITFYTPFSESKYFLKDIGNRKIIAGKIPKWVNGEDILKNESLAILNVIPTVEGAIAKAIQENESTINNSNILVLGYGRIGKILCSKLKSLGAKVYCSARKNEDFAWIKAYGYESITYEELDKQLCKMDIIFNTVPSLILDKKRISLLKEGVLVIDLASNPGGVDKEYASKLKVKVEHYLGIPGKIAPLRSSEYIKEYLYNYIKNKK